MTKLIKPNNNKKKIYYKEYLSNQNKKNHSH